MPKISIIVPVYNVEKYLKDCIESILNQTFKDFELILVNDGSTDNSLEICKYYKKIDSRILIIDKNNGGLSSARNAGLGIAKGDYIAFVDSDDYIHPQMYEILYHEIIKQKADVSMCDFKKVYELDRRLLEQKFITYKESHVLNNKEALSQLGEQNAVTYIIACNKLYASRVFEDIRFKDRIVHEDEYIIHRVLYKLNKLVYVKEKLYFYLQREGSIMDKKTSINDIDYLLACSDRVRFFHEKDLIDLKNKWQKLYLWKFFYEYPTLYKLYQNNKKLFILKNDFRKLLGILLRSDEYPLKEKCSWIIFAINSNIYYKLQK